MLNLLRYFKPLHGGFVYTDIGAPKWTPDNYDRIADDGYCKNVFAFRAISLIAKGISSIPIAAFDKNDTENARLTFLINHPNGNLSKCAFFEMLVSYLLIDGNAFIRLSDDHLECLRPDRVQIVPNDMHTDVKSYIYTIDGKKYFLDPSEILHLKMFNPLNDWYGTSPLQVAMRAIDLYNEMSNHNISLLQNGGRPSGCFKIDDSCDLSDEELEEVQQQIRNLYSGSNNAGKVFLLQGKINWQEMGLSPRDLDFTSGRDLAIREISQAFGVPPVLLGVECNSSFNSYREARLQFWEDTVLPLATIIKDEFAKWLSHNFQEEVELRLDLDAIHPLMERRESLWKKVSNADFLTINEKREMLGYPKLNKEELQNLKGEQND